MQIDHVGLEVRDVYTLELFYRTVLGFRRRYRYVSANQPGLRTVVLERDAVRLELLERPRDEAFGARRGALGHLSLAVPDVDAEHARLGALGLAADVLRAPRTTGDGLRELELRDPEGNVIELSTRVRPEPSYRIDAVIFDLDATLVDSEENYFLADEELLRRRGIRFTRDDKRRYIGGGNRDMMVDLVRRFGLRDTPEALAEEKNALYLELAVRNTPLYPEMKRFWDLLRAHGIPVAVASGSSPHVLRRVLDTVGLTAEASVIVSAEDVARGKPAPDIFVETARRLGVPPHRCAVVEDSRHGVEAAARAFMPCIAVPYLTEKPLPDAFATADLLFEDGMPTFDADRALAWVEAQRT